MDGPSELTHPFPVKAHGQVPNPTSPVTNQLIIYSISLSNTPCKPSNHQQTGMNLSANIVVLMGTSDYKHLPHWEVQMLDSLRQKGATVGTKMPPWTEEWKMNAIE
jgi:hypothetical protein